VRRASVTGSAGLLALALAALLVHVAPPGSVSPEWRLLAKPVPVLCLAAAVLVGGRGPYAGGLGAGLLASAVGDVLLELPGRFLPGLFAFLLAHVAYLAAFLSVERRPRLARALPFAAWACAVYLLLLPGLRGLALPVAAYSLAIGAMLWRASARVDPPLRWDGAWLAFAGALLFGASDTLLALDRFRGPAPGARALVLPLYWLGQLGLAASALRR
jgi:alkenylglycerophosphocholine/alkenylglycerophosphoethanolamine hydrolase